MGESPVRETSGEDHFASEAMVARSKPCFPESNSGPRNAAGNPAVAVLMFVIGKGLLARISQSGDFSPTFCAFGPTPFLGPFLPGRGLKKVLMENSLQGGIFLRGDK